MFCPTLLKINLKLEKKFIILCVTQKHFILQRWLAEHQGRVCNPHVWEGDKIQGGGLTINFDPESGEKRTFFAKYKTTVVVVGT